MHPRVYLIIPVHNRKEYTRRCLECLEKQTYINHEGILVDDGSSDGTSRMVARRFPGVTVLEGSGQLWWVGAINMGLQYVLERATDEDVVVLMNNDLTFDENLLELLVKAHKTHPLAVIGSVESRQDAPGIIVHGGNRSNFWIANSKRLNTGRHLNEFAAGHVEAVSYVTGRGVLFPIPAVRKTGLYDTRFVHRGDNEYGIRATRHGYELLVAYDAVVYHYSDDITGLNRPENRWSDLYRYLFDEHSYANIKNIYWNARLCSKNRLQGASYFLFGVLRALGHFIRRMKTTDHKTHEVP